MNQEINDNRWFSGSRQDIREVRRWRSLGSHRTPKSIVFDDGTHKRQSLGCPSHRRSSRKSVSFSVDKNVEIESHWCEAELIETYHDVWYSKSEFAEMVDELKDTVKLMRRGFPEKHEIFCYRGLEHKMPNNHQRRRSNLQTAIRIVLNHEGDTSIVDANTVAHRYSAHSRSCQEVAFEMGRADAKASREILMPSRSVNCPLPQQRRKWASAC